VKAKCGSIADKLFDSLSAPVRSRVPASNSTGGENIKKVYPHQTVPYLVFCSYLCVHVFVWGASVMVITAMHRGTSVLYLGWLRVNFCAGVQGQLAYEHLTSTSVLRVLPSSPFPLVSAVLQRIVVPVDQSYCKTQQTEMSAGALVEDSWEATRPVASRAATYFRFCPRHALQTRRQPIRRRPGQRQSFKGVTHQTCRHSRLWPLVMRGSCPYTWH